jgi:hypothetical protein
MSQRPTASGGRETAMTRQRSEDTGPFRPKDEIDELFGRANPNPNRVGCPPREVLVALARRERPINDPAYEHLTRCSPCYVEVRSIQEQDRSQRHLRLASVIGVAAAVLIAVAIGWFRFAGSGRLGPELHTELDLRPYAVTRGIGQRGDLSPLAVPHGRATLTLLLPTGSEPGRYEVQVLDSNLTSKAAAVGSATLQDHVTTLRVSIDASSFTGQYQLAVRRTGDQWQMFPIEVK